MYTLSSVSSYLRVEMGRYNCTPIPAMPKITLAPPIAQNERDKTSNLNLNCFYFKVSLLRLET
jgi:hypothetical protein